MGWSRTGVSCLFDLQVLRASSVPWRFVFVWFFFDGVSYTVVAQGCFRHKFLFFPIGLIFVCLFWQEVINSEFAARIRSPPMVCIVLLFDFRFIYTICKQIFISAKVNMVVYCFYFHFNTLHLMFRHAHAHHNRQYSFFVYVLFIVYVKSAAAAASAAHTQQHSTFVTRRACVCVLLVGFVCVRQQKHRERERLGQTRIDCRFRATIRSGRAEWREKEYKRNKECK